MEILAFCSSHQNLWSRQAQYTTRSLPWKFRLVQFLIRYLSIFLSNSFIYEWREFAQRDSKEEEEEKLEYFIFSFYIICFTTYHLNFTWLYKQWRVIASLIFFFFLEKGKDLLQRILIAGAKQGNPIDEWKTNIAKLLRSRRNVPLGSSVITKAKTIYKGEEFIFKVYIYIMNKGFLGELTPFKCQWEDNTQMGSQKSYVCCACNN